MKKNILILKSFLMPLLIGGLMGCETYFSDNGDGGNRSGKRGGIVADFAEGSALAGELRRDDRIALRQGVISALEKEMDGEVVRWQGVRASGDVTAGQFFIANIMPDPDVLVPVQERFETGFRLETEQGEFVLARNSNIRSGPSTSFEILQTLSSGTGVSGLGRVVSSSASDTSDGNWMMVGLDGTAIGYVYEPLLVKAPGTTALELAGGPVRQPYLCREFQQSLRIAAQRDRWRGIACDYGQGWEVAPIGGPGLLGNG